MKTIVSVFAAVCIAATAYLAHAESETTESKKGDSVVKSKSAHNSDNTRSKSETSTETDNADGSKTTQKVKTKTRRNEDGTVKRQKTETSSKTEDAPTK